VGEYRGFGVKFPTPGAELAVKSPPPRGLTYCLNNLTLVASKITATATWSVILPLIMKIGQIIGQTSITPGVGTRSNVKSLPGVWGYLGVRHEIDRCIFKVILSRSQHS